MTREWTTPDAVVARARVQWRRGTPLKAEASGDPYPGVRVPVKGPTPAQRAARYDELKTWLDAWRSVPSVMHVEWKAVNDRLLGSLELPVAGSVGSAEDVASVVGGAAVRELAVFRRNLAVTPEEFRPYAARRPWRLVEIGTEWAAVVSAAQWLARNPESGLHPRQVPAEGVHTKIIERYRQDLAGMLRDDVDTGSTGARFGLVEKPARIRMRFLDPELRGSGPWSDVEVPLHEADAHPIQASTIFFVENEVSFLALPKLPGTVAISGGGRAAASLVENVSWLTEVPVIRYWGDIDTWGFLILDELRRAVAGRASVESLLMDTATLCAHRAVWGREERPTNAACEQLSELEAQTYRALVTNRYGSALRLEQERIPWPGVLRALEAAWTTPLSGTECRAAPN